MAVSLAQLCAVLDGELLPCEGTSVGYRELSGVHISELEDPTPYLEGGELLLTTGMPIVGATRDVRSYVLRLLEHNVAALGLGLGAGTDLVPTELATACRELGMELLVVPDGVPFMHVSRGFWNLVGRAEQAALAESLSKQTRLARASTRSDGAASIVRVLAEAIDGWAAYWPVDGTASVVWPQSRTYVIPQLRKESTRLKLGGVHFAATFPLDGIDVVEYSIVVEERIVGFLAVGIDRPPRKTDRELMLTSCMLLSGTAHRDLQLARMHEFKQRTVATLIINDFVEAARVVRGNTHMLPEVVRILAIRGDRVEELSSAEVAHAVATMAGDRGGSQLHDQIQDSELWCLLNNITYLILDEAPRGFSTGSCGVEGAPKAEIATVPIAACLSGPMFVHQVSGSVFEVGEACRRAPIGVFVAVNRFANPEADSWVRALQGFARADLVATVRSYLRHRGRWELAARDLGVHRNSVRHRIAIATALIDADLEDPDVAANLWLAINNAPARLTS